MYYSANNTIGGSVNSVIHLYSSISGFVISNRLIEGSDAPISIGIYDRGNITGDVLMNNTFITNKLGYLYREDF